MILSVVCHVPETSGTDGAGGGAGDGAGSGDGDGEGLGKEEVDVIPSAGSWLTSADALSPSLAPPLVATTAAAAAAPPPATIPTVVAETPPEAAPPPAAADPTETVFPAVVTRLEIP